MAAPYTQPWPLATPHRKRVFAQLRSWVMSGSSSGDSVNEPANGIVINFPAMPDVIELARKANYSNVASNSPASPDGFHIYKNTEPLKIPIKFSAHSFDSDFTGDDGPVALLQMAARLHTLTVPVLSSTATRGGATGLVSTPSSPPTAPSAPPVSTEIPAKTQPATNVQSEDVTAQNATDQYVYFPVPCILNIMFAKWRGVEYGIYCSGFVEDVAVTLRGPWLQGQAAGRDLDDLRNMPSIVDYAFTFVYQPGYTNNFLGGQVNANVANQLMLQTMAKDIYQRLFNQIQLDKISTAFGGITPITAVDITGVQLQGQITGKPPADSYTPGGAIITPGGLTINMAPSAPTG